MGLEQASKIWEVRTGVAVQGTPWSSWGGTRRHFFSLFLLGRCVEGFTSFQCSPGGRTGLGSQDYVYIYLYAHYS